MLNKLFSTKVSSFLRQLFSSEKLFENRAELVRPNHQVRTGAEGDDIAEGLLLMAFVCWRTVLPPYSRIIADVRPLAVEVLSLRKEKEALLRARRMSSQSGIYDPGWGVGKYQQFNYFAANFERLVLGCIETDFCK